MSSRDNILNRIASNKPTLVDLPLIDIDAVVQYDDLFEQFKMVIEGIGGDAIALESMAALLPIVEADKQSGDFIVDTIFDTAGNEALQSATAESLLNVKAAYIKGTIAVAENGAVWVAENQMINRVVPFICEQLILIIDRNQVVPTMHHAYQTTDTSAQGFGVFIAGPSKTADIEQSLVIGAHGAKRLTVYIVGK